MSSLRPSEVPSAALALHEGAEAGAGGVSTFAAQALACRNFSAV